MTASRNKTEAGGSGREPVLVDLALQGGGAHGAYTWGVLDRLLEESWLSYDGISGTSAGAMNAAVMAHGLARGGPGQARVELERFWKKVAEAALLSPFRRGPLEILTGQWTLVYDILVDCVDFTALKTAGPKLFVTATNVHTGRGRVFRNAEMTPEVLLASACLPTMFQAVEIDGEPYWDGGFSGNPTMTPLIRECESQDTILVSINPIERPGTPRTPVEIQNRLNEISFNSPLVKELRMAALLRRVADPGSGEGAMWARMRIHRVAGEQVMLGLGYSSKLLAEWSFFCMLHEEGRRAAEVFLETHGNDIGVRSTLDIDRLIDES
ncbi:MAG: patatin-like phospholipase family protein [Thiobacillaceae bacterium]|nr:patatin-like phospholipase family protein [Thiobacillaceae bacterium]